MSDLACRFGRAVRTQKFLLMETSFLNGQLSWQGAIAQLVERLVRNEKVSGSTFCLAPPLFNFSQPVLPTAIRFKGLLNQQTTPLISDMISARSSD